MRPPMGGKKAESAGSTSRRQRHPSNDETGANVADIGNPVIRTVRRSLFDASAPIPEQVLLNAVDVDVPAASDHAR